MAELGNVRVIVTDMQWVRQQEPGVLRRIPGLGDIYPRESLDGLQVGPPAERDDLASLRIQVPNGHAGAEVAGCSPVKSKPIGSDETDILVLQCAPDLGPPLPQNRHSFLSK